MSWICTYLLLTTYYLLLSTLSHLVPFPPALLFAKTSEFMYVGWGVKLRLFMANATPARKAPPAR